MSDVVLWVLVIAMVVGLYLWGRRGGVRRLRSVRGVELNEADAQRIINDYRAVLERSAVAEPDGPDAATLGDERLLPYPKPQIRIALEMALQRPFVDDAQRERLVAAYVALARFQPGAPEGAEEGSEEGTAHATQGGGAGNGGGNGSGEGDGDAGSDAADARTYERYRAEAAELETRLRNLGVMP